MASVWRSARWTFDLGELTGQRIGTGRVLPAGTDQVRPGEADACSVQHNATRRSRLVSIQCRSGAYHLRSLCWYFVLVCVHHKRKLSDAVLYPQGDAEVLFQKVLHEWWPGT
jgi:hypothetical protein